MTVADNLQTSDPRTAGDEHPSWCTRDEAPGRTHRSRPRVVDSDHGGQTRVYLDAGDTGPVLLVLEHTRGCFDPGDHGAHGECGEPDVVPLVLSEARQLFAGVEGLLAQA